MKGRNISFRGFKFIENENLIKQLFKNNKSINKIIYNYSGDLLGGRQDEICFNRDIDTIKFKNNVNITSTDIIKQALDKNETIDKTKVTLRKISDIQYDFLSSLTSYDITGGYYIDKNFDIMIDILVDEEKNDYNISIFYIGYINSFMKRTFLKFKVADFIITDKKNIVLNKEFEEYVFSMLKSNSLSRTKTIDNIKKQGLKDIILLKKDICHDILKTMKTHDEKELDIVNQFFLSDNAKFLSLKEFEKAINTKEVLYTPTSEWDRISFIKENILFNNIFNKNINNFAKSKNISVQELEYINDTLQLSENIRGEEKDSLKFNKYIKLINELKPVLDIDKFIKMETSNLFFIYYTDFALERTTNKEMLVELINFLEYNYHDSREFITNFNKVDAYVLKNIFNQDVSNEIQKYYYLNVIKQNLIEDIKKDLGEKNIRYDLAKFTIKFDFVFTMNILLKERELSQLDKDYIKYLYKNKQACNTFEKPNFNLLDINELTDIDSYIESFYNHSFIKNALKSINRINSKTNENIDFMHKELTNLKKLILSNRQEYICFTNGYKNNQNPFSNIIYSYLIIKDTHFLKENDLEQIKTFEKSKIYCNCHNLNNKNITEDIKKIRSIKY